MKRSIPNRANRRKRLRYERLESRNLLAADSFSAWTHPLDPADTNGDGRVTAADSLVIVNQLSRAVDSQAAEIGAPPILGLAGNRLHLDSTGDGELTVSDAFAVINRLYRNNVASSDAESELADAPVADGQAEIGTAEEVTTINFSDDFARVAGTLSETNLSDTYRFVATRPRATVDLNSVLDEAIAEVRVLDADENEITSSSVHVGRQRYEGIDFPTQAGGEYFVEIEYAGGTTDPPEDFEYALTVFQFEPSRWLPASSGEVTEVGGADREDIGDSIATATTVPIRPNGSSFVQSLEVAGDVDVIELPNALPGSVYVSGLPGISFELLTEDGEVLERTAMDISVNGDTDLGYYAGGQTSAIGSESVYLRIYSTAGAVGEYNVSVLFDGGPDEQPTDAVLDQYREEDAVTVSFEDNTASLSGATEISGQVRFYRFSTSAIRADVTIRGDEGIQVQLFRASDQSPISGIGDTQLSAHLPGRFSGRASEVIMAVWNPRQASQYAIDIELIEGIDPPDDSPQDDIDVETRESAISLPPRQTDQSNLIHTTVELGGGDVTLYRFSAVDSRVLLAVSATNEDGFLGAPVLAHLFDSQGRQVVGTQLGVDHPGVSTAFQLRHRLFTFETMADEEYFLRLSNLNDSPSSIRVAIR